MPSLAFKLSGFIIIKLNAIKNKYFIFFLNNTVVTSDPKILAKINDDYVGVVYSVLSNSIAAANTSSLVYKFTDFRSSKAPDCIIFIIIDI